MNPEVKAKWLEALRSGEYKQGTGHLNRGRRYCCLGVLCEVAIQEGLNLSVTREGPRENVTAFYNNSAGLLPEAVVEWAGLTMTNPEFFTDDQESWSLASKNDSGATFEEIANLIEEHL